MDTVIIRTYGDPILRKKADPLLIINAEITRRLEAVLAATGAAGMSAPQIGESCRVICFRNEDEIISLINPRVSSIASMASTVDEGCWSILGVLAPVSRPVACEVVGTRPTGEEVTLSLHGLPAKACLHEMDHLNGVLFVDYLPEVKRHLVLRKHRKFKIDKQVRANGIRIQLRP
jgi:peptide deformylase